MTTRAPSQSIVMEYDLPYSPAKVWRALTEPTLLGRWLMATDMRACVGQQFTFRAEPTPWWDGVVHCEVLEIEPGERLRYSWRTGSEASPLDTVVTWTLTPTESGGTRLSLEHTGFTSDTPRFFEGARFGWQRMVGQELPQVLAALG
jgi:uncharacterized protein YndB with AHSA1/START domain